MKNKYTIKQLERILFALRWFLKREALVEEIICTLENKDEALREANERFLLMGIEGYNPEYHYERSNNENKHMS